MVTAGLFGDNKSSVLGLTRRGEPERVKRAIYSQALLQRQAAEAVVTGLTTRVFDRSSMPYLGLAPSLAGLLGLGDDPIVFNADGSINEAATDAAMGLHTGVPTNDSYSGPNLPNGNSWTPTYADGSSSGSGADWSKVATSFFSAFGNVFGKKQPLATNMVPLPQTGPSTATVVLIAAAVGIPALFLLTRKG